MKDTSKTIGLILTILSAGATLAAAIFDKKHQETLIDERVQKYLADMVNKEG